MANATLITSVMDKRTRATKKKMEKIKQLEVKLAEGKDLDNDQVIQRRSVVVALHAVVV